MPEEMRQAAKDVYDEGALTFPCVRVQRGYELMRDLVGVAPVKSTSFGLS